MSIVIIPLLIPALVFGGQKSLQAKIVKVSDGDTVVVGPIEGGAFFKCRLYGIDAPEGGQNYGDDAAAELKHLVLAQTVQVQTTGDVTHNREVCHITLNGLDINLEMVKRGHAWAYRKFLKKPYKEAFILAETEARNKRLGLWKDDNPMPPWDYRKYGRLGVAYN